MPSTPAYRRIMTDIQGQIADGELRPGDRLPTLAELMARYQVSDQPVKAAIRLLEAAGTIVTRQGKGMYVADSLPPPTP